MMMRSLIVIIALSIGPSIVYGQSYNVVYSETLKPFTSESISSEPSTDKVDCSTMNGKILCGYQGWFNALGDQSQRGWVHWSRNSQSFQDGDATVDLLPDVRELTEAERFSTGLRYPDGSPVYVFSSFVKPTVMRHFQWMRDYGIDGVFVQRFAVLLRDPKSLRHHNTVLSHCRDGANQYGRTYALMYDLSGLQEGGTRRVIEDWKRLREKMKLTEDPAYLHHEGKPVVAVWGIGFNDNRQYTIDECARLIDFFKSEEDAGQCTLMLGIPTYWRTLERDCLDEPKLHSMFAKADVLSPWSVGRFDTPAAAEQYLEQTVAPDIKWCQRRKLDLMPVAFPGFSWHNLRNGEAPRNQIPRLKGEFFWSQIREAKEAGAKMLYVAMFDEVDEATAIFKCTNELPRSNASQFVTFEGLPSDFYLRLTGTATRWFRGELELADVTQVPR